MNKVFLYDKKDSTYLCINVTNQTSTSWRNSLAEAEYLSDITNRSLLINWVALVNMSLVEVINKITNDTQFIIHRIDNDIFTPYEFW